MGSVYYRAPTDVSYAFTQLFRPQAEPLTKVVTDVRERTVLGTFSPLFGIRVFHAI